jgi:hypothetical protein
MRHVPPCKGVGGCVLWCCRGLRWEFNIPPAPLRRGNCVARATCAADLHPPVVPALAGGVCHQNGRLKAVQRTPYLQRGN